MTRPWLRPNDKGIYICEHSALEGQIHARLHPVPARDRWFWLRASGYFAATLLTGLGILVGMEQIWSQTDFVSLVGRIWSADGGGAYSGHFCMTVS